MACTRKLFLETRLLSPSPVVPPSPVRVAICVRRLAMVISLVEKGIYHALNGGKAGSCHSPAE
jgi:hypothetical protein